MLLARSPMSTLILLAQKVALPPGGDFEENTGNIAYDAKGGNHARISGAQWVKNPDPKGSSFVIYRDGKEAAKANITRPSVGGSQFTVGARIQSSYREHFKGNLEELPHLENGAPQRGNS